MSHDYTSPVYKGVSCMSDFTGARKKNRISRKQKSLRRQKSIILEMGN